MTRLSTLACALLLLVSATGCDGFNDFVDDPLGDFQVRLQITDVNVDLGDAFALPVIPGEPRAAERDIDTNLNVQSVDDLVAITLNPSAFSFTAVPVFPGAPPPSGTVRVYTLVGGYPLPGAPVDVQIVDGAVASVTPTRLATAQSTINAADIDAFFARVPADSRPTIAPYQSLSVDEIRARIASALGTSPVRIAFGTDVQSASPTNPLAGTLTVSSLAISAIITP